jgi:hypothetical protein
VPHDLPKPKLVAAAIAVLSCASAVTPAGAAGQYSMTAPSGLVVEFDRDRLLDMRDRSVALRRDLEEDPRILYYTSYGSELRAEDRDEAYPWNAIDVVTDSIAAVVTPGNLREADRAYYNYVVHRMHAVREDPDVPCGEIVARELDAVDAFVDGWVVARTLFGGPAFEPLDELAFAREAGVLRGLLVDRSDRQLGGCLVVWSDENPGAVEEYRSWLRERYSAPRGP